MKLKSIELRGFRVFDRFTFEFPLSPGLFLLAGRNEDEPALGANGVGKSSLFDGVCFALFGKSALSSTGGDLLRDEATECTSVVTTDTHTFSRSWYPNRKAVTKLGSDNVGDKEFAAAVRLTQEMFTAATFIPQRVPLFAELSAATQVELLQQLLGLERWVDYAGRATSAASKVSTDVLKLEGNVRALQSRIDAIDTTAIERRADLWDGQQATKIVNAEDYLADCRAGETPHSKLEDWRKDLTAAQGRLRRSSNNATVYERKGEEIAAQLDVCTQESAHISAAIKSRQTEIATLKADNQLLLSGAGTCPSCHQTITDAHRKACLDAMATKIANKQDFIDADTLSLTRVREKSAALTAQRDALRTQWRDANNTVRDLNHFINGIANLIREEEQRLLLASTKIQEAMASLDDIMEEVNPHLEALETARQARHTASDNRDQETIKLRRAQDQLARTQLWSKSFKSIRSQLVSDALAQFAVEIAGTLEDLGLYGWEVTPMIDASVFESARNASGFKFVVRNASGIERNLKSYSGGEFVRAGLAVQCGLAAVIAETHGAPMDFEFWDEPTEYLSGEGVEGLFAALRTRAQRLQRPIIVVDHHRVDHSLFDGIYTLVKANGVTRLEV